MSRLMTVFGLAVGQPDGLSILVSHVGAPFMKKMCLVGTSASLAL